MISVEDQIVLEDNSKEEFRKKAEVIESMQVKVRMNFKACSEGEMKTNHKKPHF